MGEFSFPCLHRGIPRCSCHFFESFYILFLEESRIRASFEARRGKTVSWAFLFTPIRRGGSLPGRRCSSFYRFGNNSRFCIVKFYGFYSSVVRKIIDIYDNYPSQGPSEARRRRGFRRTGIISSTTGSVPLKAVVFIEPSQMRNILMWYTESKVYKSVPFPKNAFNSPV